MPAKRAKKASKASRTSAKKAKATKGRAKASKAAKRPAARKPAARAAREPRNTCAATDPFGGPCQNTPRLGSRYCGVHSHLEAMA